MNGAFREERRLIESIKEKVLLEGSFDLDAAQFAQFQRIERSSVAQRRRFRQPGQGRRHGFQISFGDAPPGLAIVPGGIMAPSRR